MNWCGSKNKYLKNACINNIRLHVQNMFNHFRFNNRHNWGGGAFHEHENIHFDNE